MKPLRIVAWLHQRDQELSWLEQRNVWIPLPPVVLELQPRAEQRAGGPEHVKAAVGRVMAHLAGRVVG